MLCFFFFFKPNSHVDKQMNFDGHQYSFYQTCVHFFKQEIFSFYVIINSFFERFHSCPILIVYRVASTMLNCNDLKLISYLLLDSFCNCFLFPRLLLDRHKLVRKHVYELFSL